MSDSSDSRDTALTERQRTILEVIRSSVTNRGYPPSIREIGDAVGLTSTSSVAHQLRTLERKGYLRRDPNRPRAVDVRGSDDMPMPTITTDVGGSDALPEPTFVPVVASRPAARFWPNRRSRTSSRFRANSSARAHYSCSRSSASR
jgi:repressor LexA